MALKGQLHDFNLAEILQLIATQQKSGFLVLEGHREMVFVFDKGRLISTRDRRSEAADPLEEYLRNYGFFSEAQWSHIAYIRQNSSLDLAEILLSEELLERDVLNVVMQGVAREMAHRGMKMRRGRYHFTATKDTPPGVRWRVEMDVQGLLMEAARRVDEEPGLLQALPSQNMTFAQGDVPPSADSLSTTGRRIIKLALGGRPLGRIIRLARTDSFTCREMLKHFVDQGWLVPVIPEDDAVALADAERQRQRKSREGKLRRPLVSLLVLLVMLGFGAFRWTPLLLGEMALVGLAEPVVSQDAAATGGPGVSWLDDDQLACRHLRLRQLQAEVNEAAQQYRDAHGSFPDALVGLVEEGMLAPSVQRTIDRLGWQYAQRDDGRGYVLGR
ncbi:MAG: DUF4388 domain-containing protein [Candidatus Krumholzibacteriia bacterium]